jgi:putative addiction module component (TIGR02574 family)
MKFKVALYHSEEGYSVCAVGLPGCWSQGTTEAEALENIADAIREYLAVATELEEGAVIREIEVAIEDLWDDLAASPESVPIHQWQKDELARRKANLQENPPSGLAWDEVQRRVRSRHGR